jgi:hypothetical protein
MLRAIFYIIATIYRSRHALRIAIPMRAARAFWYPARDVFINQMELNLGCRFCGIRVVEFVVDDKAGRRGREKGS